MSNPFKPTPRVLELLGYVERGWIWGSHYSKPYNYRGYRILVAKQYSGIRNPSQKELLHLLTFDLCDEVASPGKGDTFDTSTKPETQVAVGKKMILKPLGERLLKESRQ